MKKATFFAVLALGCATVQAQDWIYDGHWTGFGTNGYTFDPGNELAGDSFGLIAPPAGQRWRITTVEIVTRWTVAGQYTIDSLGISLYNQTQLGVGSPAFSDLAGSVDVSRTFSSGELTVHFHRFNDLAIDLAPAPGGIGYGIQLSLNSYTGPGVGTFGYKDLFPSPGTSTNGFFYDINDNGVITGNEFTSVPGWSTPNLVFRLLATPIPEPASIVALGIGVLALIRRRKKD